MLGPAVGEGEGCCFSPGSDTHAHGSSSDTTPDSRWTSPSSSRSPARLKHVSVQVAPYQPHPSEFGVATIVTSAAVPIALDEDMDAEAEGTFTSSTHSHPQASSSHPAAISVTHPTSFPQAILAPHVPSDAMNGVGWKLGSGISEVVKGRWKVLGERGMRGEMRGR